MIVTLRDCELKGLVLRSIRNGHQTSKSIYHDIDYNNWNSLLSEITQLKNRGYISKTEHNGKLNQYELTKLGQEHAHDPMINKRWKRNRIKEIIKDHVEAILLNNDKFKAAVEKATEKLARQMDNGNVVVTERRYKKPRKEQNTMTIRRQDITKSPRIAKRQKLVVAYRNSYLDDKFFKSWGGIKPVKLVGTGLGKPGSVEIISTSHNKEVKRNHVHFVFDAYYIILGEFYISNIVDNGIYIFGIGMKNQQFLKF